MGASVWIVGSYQSDFARNYARGPGGLTMVDVEVYGKMLSSDVGCGPIARAQLPGQIASGTHSCWAPGGRFRGW
jgi:hypothetical protein